uniref:Uncharacterized protein n=1 Tax=Salix viminalis TaxID=40686 RepID=A0A6N2L6H1_SALVM
MFNWQRSLQASTHDTFPTTLTMLIKSKLFLHYASLTSKASQLEYARTPFPPQRPISLIVRQIIGINILLQVQQFVTLRLNFPALSSELASLVV